MQVRGAFVRNRLLQTSELAAHQHRRLTRVLIGPLAVRLLLPSVAAWWGFLLTVTVFTRARWPDVDINGWPFILAVCPASCLIFATAVAVGQALFVRWLFRRHSRGRGRRVALRWVLCPSDREPSRWRRLWLSACGVTDSDLSEIRGKPDRPGRVR